MSPSHSPPHILLCDVTTHCLMLLIRVHYYTEVPVYISHDTQSWVFNMSLVFETLNEDLTLCTEWYRILKLLWEELSVGFSVPVEAWRYFRRKSQPCNSYLTWKLSVIFWWRGIKMTFKYLIFEIYKFPNYTYPPS